MPLLQVPDRTIRARFDLCLARGTDCNALPYIYDARTAHRAGACCKDAPRIVIAFSLIGQSVAEQLNAAADFDSRRVLFEDSIYRDLGLFDAISVHLKDLSGVIRLDDHLVGVDKIGHFLAQGWRYFEIAYLDEEGIEAAMRWGELTEADREDERDDTRAVPV